jgi:hypothetical protein
VYNVGVRSSCPALAGFLFERQACLFLRIVGMLEKRFNTSYALNGPCLTHFQSRGVASLANYTTIANLLEGILQIWPAQAIQVAPTKYESVFPDRLAVGWMVYLPHVLTQAEVPEARALIQVARDGQQQGTIIVRVTDEVFDADNLDHVKVANDIEIRLADQDLLPRFVDL